MSHFSISKINGQEYIYCGVSNREAGKKDPKRRITYLGKIDQNSRKPIFSNKQINWVSENLDDLKINLGKYASKRNIILNLSDIDTIDSQIKPLTQNQNDNIIDIIATNGNKKIFSINDIRNSEQRIYGSIFLLDFITKRINLLKILSDSIKHNLNEILTLAYFYVIDPDPVMYCRYFSELYDTVSQPTDVASQRISELFSDITESQRNIFYRLWSKYIQDIDYIVLDTTSISTYSLRIETAEMGKPKQYNKNKKIKQVNLYLLFGENTGLPIYSCTHLGSTNDVTLLVNDIQKYDFICHNNFKLVLDRYFYSKNNLLYMLNYKPKIKFIIGLPATTSLKHDLIDKYRYIFLNHSYLIDTPTNPIYGVTKRIVWNHRYLNAHIYIDQNKYLDTHNQIAEELNNLYKLIKQNPKFYAKDIDCLTFFNIKKRPGKSTGYTVTRRQDAFDKALSKAGWFIFLSNDIINSEKTIEIYRKRDIIEKSFNILKNKTEQETIRCHTELCSENKIFISFLSLIILSYIHKIMLDNNLYRQYTIKELFKILNGIKIIKTNKLNIVSPVTAKQKKIFDAFGCPYPQSF
ncbi:MAG: transposase [Deltaproteobacteria bacterium]|jgi:transposase|nr:transposase [Deltaproteobacteria bacterium]